MNEVLSTKCLCVLRAKRYAILTFSGIFQTALQSAEGLSFGVDCVPLRLKPC